MTDLHTVDSGISTQALRHRLAGQIHRHAANDGRNPTAIPGLTLNRVSHPSPCISATYEPRLVVFAQGEKRIQVHQTTLCCDSSTFLLAAVDIPVLSQITQAAPDRPMLAMVLQLDLAEIRRIVVRGEFHFPAATPAARAIVSGVTSASLLEPCLRLLGLLDHPEDIPFLGQSIQREILYRLLRGDHGAQLHAIATAGEQSHRTAKAIAWLRIHYTQPLRIEELAQRAEMGISTLHHHFRTLTGMSPLQYQKRLRLHVARERLLQTDQDVATAAYAVGYESLSQFNREYNRLFGKPPRRDIEALRERLVAAD